jgi:metal-responsive CopG/Arc/MetJ family transcriptional regulator
LTVSLPVSLVEALDRFLANGTSRSAAVRQAVAQAIEDARRREAIDQYVRGYEAQPQTQEEFGWADVVAVEFFAEHSSE